MIRVRSESDLWNLMTYASVLGPLTIGLALVLVGYFIPATELGRGGGVILLAALFCGLFQSQFASYRFTILILIANISALLAPSWFDSIGGLQLADPWLMLIVVQLIMFGMGTQMSFQDFANIVKMPYAVIVGLLCQFVIMPLLGFVLAWLLGLPDEIAAGVVLIGSCSSGLASNVMVYLARGNLALSVTITALATIFAPLLTPMWMKLLASSFVEVDTLTMSFDIIKIVIVPILAAFVHDWISHGNLRTRAIVYSLVAIGFIWLSFLMLGGWRRISDLALEPTQEQLVSLLGFFSAAFCAGILAHFLFRVFPKLESHMPKISIAGIVVFTLVSTAQGSEHLKVLGFTLVLAALLHNTLGYLLGYWGGRLFGLNKTDSITVAIEVGTQNGSMGIGIAKSMDKLATVGLASIVFAPLMNVTGSILANNWRKATSREDEASEAFSFVEPSVDDPNARPKQIQLTESKPI